MAEDQAEDVDASASEEPKKKKGGKKKLIIIVAAVVLVGVGAYWFLLKPGGSAGASGCPPTTLPGWQPASAKQLQAAKAATKTSPPGETGNTNQTKPEGANKPDCEAPEPPKPGAVVKVEPMTISLADGSYLKVGLGLQLAEGGGDPKAWTETNRGLRAQNVAVRVLGARTAAQLAPGKPRDEAQAELKRQVAVAFASEDGTKSEVIDVLFTEFVMQ